MVKKKERKKRSGVDTFTLINYRVKFIVYFSLFE